MNNLLGLSLSAVRSDNWFNLKILACSAVLLGFDVYLFKTGMSWTPVHYESLAPLLALGYQRQQMQVMSSVSAVLLFGTIAVLFFSFGLTYSLTAESWLFIGGAIATLLTWLLPVLKQIWQHRRVPLWFLVAGAALLVADKGISRDMMASAYLPHFFKIDSESRSTTLSNNPVYASFKQNLRPGRGGVLIVFESLGVPKNKSVIQSLRQTYSEFEFSPEPFEGGSTIPAEVRYLCGVNGNITDFSTCLPHLLPSLAMHGNSLSYFNRRILYQNMGFNQAAGKYELTGLATCRFSYTAVCDQALWERLLKNVRTSKCESFHYLLTIDSHFPYTKYSEHIDGLYTDLRSLLDVMKRIRVEFPDCDIVIVGDHPPPFAPNFESKEVLTVTALH